MLTSNFKLNKTSSKAASPKPYAACNNNKDDVNPIQAAAHKLPRIDGSGIPFMTDKEGSNGHGLLDGRKKLDMSLKVREYLDRHYPNRPFHIVPDARH